MSVKLNSTSKDFLLALRPGSAEFKAVSCVYRNRVKLTHLNENLVQNSIVQCYTYDSPSHLPELYIHCDVSGYNPCIPSYDKSLKRNEIIYQY